MRKWVGRIIAAIAWAAIVLDLYFATNLMFLRWVFGRYSWETQGGIATLLMLVNVFLATMVVGVFSNGRHREAAKAAHRDPANGAGAAKGGTTTTITIKAGTVQAVTFGAGAGATGAEIDKPAPPVPGDLKLGEIIAWRCWQVVSTGLTSDQWWLRSIYSKIVWAPGDPMKHDSQQGSKLGDFDGGVHAWKDGTAALNYIAGTDGQFVIGRVALWGEVIEHERGYRAEFAKIISLDSVVRGQQSWLAPLRQKYLAKQEQKA